MQRHQNVRGFYVAMDNSFLVRVLDGGTDIQEQVQASLGGELCFVAKLDDRQTLDEIHDEVGSTAVGRAYVQDLGNIRMVHECEGLPFGLEPGHHAFGIHPELDDL